MIEIDTCIPIPNKPRRGPVPKYPFDVLQIGESIHFDESVSRPKLASMTSNKNRILEPKVFVVRNVSSDDPKGKGYRIFRVK